MTRKSIRQSCGAREATMRIEVDDKWRVTASSEIEAPISASQMWGQMRDWVRFATRDPLHARIRITSSPAGDAMSAGQAVRGSTFVIEHRLFGIGPDRIGRMLVWREGSGFAFSDLSRRGVKVGFPHVCSYHVAALTEHSCRLHVSARGRWTARWMPRWMIHLWLRWVLLETGLRIRHEINQFRAWRARTAQQPSIS